MNRVLFGPLFLLGLAQADEAAFTRTAALIGRDDARAAAELEALAIAHPDDDYAADALIQAAELNEEKLRRPDHAAQLYARLSERYPTSRLTLRARARHDFLVANLGSGAEVLAEYQDILQRYGSRPLEESVARMEHLLAAHPAFPLAGEGQLWLARSDLSAGRFARAIERYGALERQGRRLIVTQAQRGRADALLGAGHFIEARELYRTIGSQDGVEQADRALLAWGLWLASLVYLVAFLMGIGWRARLELGRISIELKFYLPVAALLLAAGATAQRPIWSALAIIAVGGGLIVWVAGTTRPHSLRGLLAQALGIALSVSAVTYVAIYACDLGSMVAETLRHGPDR